MKKYSETLLIHFNSFIYYHYMFYLKIFHIINCIKKTMLVDTRRYSHENDNTNVKQRRWSLVATVMFSHLKHIYQSSVTLLSGPVAGHEVSIILEKVSIYHKQHKINQLFRLFVDYFNSLHYNKKIF